MYDTTGGHPAQYQAQRGHAQGPLVFWPKSSRMGVWAPAASWRHQGRALNPQTCSAGLASPSICLGCRSTTYTATATANSRGEHWTNKTGPIRQRPQMPENALGLSHGFRSWFPSREAPGCHLQKPSPNPSPHVTVLHLPH